MNLSGIAAGAGNGTQTLTVSAVSSNPGLVPNPSVAYTSPNATGSLSFTPVANGNGTATVTVTVNNGASSSNVVTQSFTVTVNAVAQPPTLNPIGNVSVTEDAGAQTVSLTGISPGSSGAQSLAAQPPTLTITAISSNTNLVPNPTVIYSSPNSVGMLSFAPITNRYGTAVITVTLTVNYGVSNSIVTQNFTVSVNGQNQSPTLDPLNNLTVVEGAGNQTVQLTGISSGLTNKTQRLIIAAKSSNPRLVSRPTVSYVAPNTTGTLTFTPANNLVGTAKITVAVYNGQRTDNSVIRSFNVTIVAKGSTTPKITSTPAAVSAVTVSPTAAVLATATTPVAGQFALTVTGVSGGKYAVQATTDLVNWISLQTNMSPFTFVDSNASKFNQRFYRTVLVP